MVIRGLLEAYADPKPWGTGNWTPGEHQKAAYEGNVWLRELHFGQRGVNRHRTATEFGRMDPRKLERVPGGSKGHPEHELFAASPIGKYADREEGQKSWDEFVDSIKRLGVVDPVFVMVDYDKGPQIYEGNHRVRAAIEAGLDSVPVEIRYWGMAEEKWGWLNGTPNNMKLIGDRKEYDD